MNRERPDSFSLGIVIPCYNEEEVIPKLVAELDRFAASVPYPVRVLFIDDGSRDRTCELLHHACRSHANFAFLRFSRNFGHQTGVTAGLAHIRGEVIGVIDADLQDPLDVLGDMVGEWRKGNDVVYGIRKNRKEGALLRFAYASFYRILKKMANIEIPLDSGDFCVMDRRVVDVINGMPEHNRFIRGMRGWVGFKQHGHPYERLARAAGQPKYNLSRLMKLAFDGIISFSTVPLRLATLLGLAAGGLGLIYLLVVIITKIVNPAAPLGWASTVAVVIFLGGAQLVVLGIIGEYLGRIFEECKRRPLFLVERTDGWLREDGKS